MSGKSQPLAYEPIPFREITECDHCGTCCEVSPCLLGSYADLRAVEAAVGSIRHHLRVEATPAGKWQVRVSGSPCVFHVEQRCALEDVKPQGGRDFKCWDRRTYSKTYHWTPNQLRKIGFTPP